MSNINLDIPKVFRQYDPESMALHLRDLPRQCQQAWQMAMGFTLPADYTGVDKVVILGMGGSAIGGNLVSGLAASEARLPILVHRDYNLPAFVDERTLVIASSYSGNTEEILSSFEQSLKTKAKKLAITTGGKLKAMAEAARVPVFSFAYKAQPRAAPGYSILPILGFLQKLGFLSDKSTDVSETIQVLHETIQKINEQVPTPDNPAKQLARYLYGHLPVIYGADFITEVAHRWKTQLNENSKAWAFHEVFPELNHNAVVGYQFPRKLASRIRVIILRSSLLGQRTLLRQKITYGLLKDAGVDCQYVDGKGNCQLSQMMSLVLIGDYVSYYLAILYRTDPTPVKVIDYLKEQLARG